MCRSRGELIVGTTKQWHLESIFLNRRRCGCMKGELADFITPEGEDAIAELDALLTFA
jgi:hypothetical protein